METINVQAYQRLATSISKSLAQLIGQSKVVSLVEENFSHGEFSIEGEEIILSQGSPTENWQKLISGLIHTLIKDFGPQLTQKILLSAYLDLKDIYHEVPLGSELLDLMVPAIVGKNK